MEKEIIKNSNEQLRLDELLKKYSNEYPNVFQNEIEKDKVLFNMWTSEILNIKVDYDANDITKLLMSISSSKQSLPIPKNEMFSFEEKGYYPLDFFIIFFRFLIETYFRELFNNDDKNLIKLLKREIIKLHELIEVEKVFFRSIKNQNFAQYEFIIFNKLSLLNSGCSFINRVGFKGHSFYILYLKEDEKLFGIIHNLGRGCELHFENNNEQLTVPPIVIEICDIGEHVKKLTFYNSYRRDEDCVLSDTEINYILPGIYTSGAKFVGYGVKEISQFPQETGNCVAKNYLHVISTRYFCKNKQHYFPTVIKSYLSTMFSNYAFFKKNLNEEEACFIIENTNYSLKFKSELRDIVIFGCENYIDKEISQMKKIVSSTSGLLVGMGTYKFLESREDMPEWFKLVLAASVGGITAYTAHKIQENKEDVEKIVIVDNRSRALTYPSQQTYHINNSEINDEDIGWQRAKTMAKEIHEFLLNVFRYLNNEIKEIPSLKTLRNINSLKKKTPYNGFFLIGENLFEDYKRHYGSNESSGTKINSRIATNTKSPLLQGIFLCISEIVYLYYHRIPINERQLLHDITCNDLNSNEIAVNLPIEFGNNSETIARIKGDISQKFHAYPLSWDHISIVQKKVTVINAEKLLTYILKKELNKVVKNKFKDQESYENRQKHCIIF